MVPMTPAVPPSKERQLAISWVVVLLPLVPVTPTNCSCLPGSP